jgi:ubiquitin-protein ligase
MAVTTPPIALQNAGATHTAETHRNAYSVAISGARAAASLVPRGGVHPALGKMMAVTQQGSPTMGITVGSGVCAVAGTEGASQGAYYCLAQSDTNISVTAAHASLARIDIVVARVQDSAYSGAVNSFTLEVVAGTPSGSPAVPTVPNNSMVLAHIAVAANATQIVNANITDKRPYIGMGILPVATSADLPTVTFDGMFAFDRATDTLYWADTAGVWQRQDSTKPVTQISVATDSASVTNASELTVLTLPSFTYKAGKAYKVNVQVGIKYPTTATGIYLRVRKANPGQVVIDLQRVPFAGYTGVSIGVDRERVFVVGGSDVTASLVLTGQTTANTAIVEGTSTAQRAMYVYEAGVAADYPAAQVLV